MNPGKMLKELLLVDHVTLPNSLPAIFGPNYCVDDHIESVESSSCNEWPAMPEWLHRAE